MTDAIAAGAPVDRLARYFEYWLLRLQGVYPSIAACPGCGEPLAGGAVMPPRDDLFVCRRCAPAGGTPVGVEAMRFLKARRRARAGRAGRVAAGGARGARARDRHRRLMHLHLDKDLKSARVLRR